MRVLINGVSALKPKTGVGHTTQNLHRALASSHPGDSFWLYPGETIANLAKRTLVKPKPRPGGTDKQESERSLRAHATHIAKAAYRVHLGFAARWGRFDLYHEPNFVPIRTHLPTIVTVHDLSVVLHPEWHPLERVRFHERHFARGIAAAEHVIVVSESVRREAIDILGLDPSRVTAVRNGIGSSYRPQDLASVEAMRHRLQLPPRYTLAVGTIEPRKNIRTLLQAFCDLPTAVREACPLVLAGGWGWKSDAERELFEAEARPRGAIHLGYVADADLPALYAGAAALLFPSFYEGFGLPPVEMLACGGGVIASTATVVREVVGRHAVLLDPLDLEGWREAMHRVATAPDFLNETRRGGVAHAHRFTWEQAATETFAVYQQVLGIAAVSPLRSISTAA